MAFFCLRYAHTPTQTSLTCLYHIEIAQLSIKQTKETPTQCSQQTDTYRDPLKGERRKCLVPRKPESLASHKLSTRLLCYNTQITITSYTIYHWSSEGSLYIKHKNWLTPEYHLNNAHSQMEWFHVKNSWCWVSLLTSEYSMSLISNKPSKWRKKSEKR